MSAFTSFLGGPRRLVLDVGSNVLLSGPIRRAIVEPAAAASDELLRLLLSYYGERLWQAGLIAGSSGNLSARLHRRNAIYVTSHATSKAFLRRSDIRSVPLEEDGSDTTSVSVELPMHRACYSSGEELGAVIHTHAPALTAIGLLDIDLGEVLPEVKASLNRVARVAHAPAGSSELADSVGEAVSAGAGLVLLERHGAVTVGRDLNEACDRMELGELSAKAVLLARGEAVGR